MYLAPDLRARSIAANVNLIANEIERLIPGHAAETVLALCSITHDSAEKLIASVAPRASVLSATSLEANSRERRPGTVIAFPGCTIPN